MLVSLKNLFYYSFRLFQVENSFSMYLWMLFLKDDFFTKSSTTLSILEKKKLSLKMKIFAIFTFFAIHAISNAQELSESPQNINKLLNNQVVVSR